MVDFQVPANPKSTIESESRLIHRLVVVIVAHTVLSHGCFGGFFGGVDLDDISGPIG